MLKRLSSSSEVISTLFLVRREFEGAARRGRRTVVGPRSKFDMPIYDPEIYDVGVSAATALLFEAALDWSCPHIIDESFPLDSLAHVARSRRYVGARLILCLPISPSSACRVMLTSDFPEEYPAPLAKASLDAKVRNPSTRTSPCSSIESR